jgi:hypothetical protein
MQFAASSPFTFFLGCGLLSTMAALFNSVLCIFLKASKVRTGLLVLATIFILFALGIALLGVMFLCLPPGGVWHAANSR